MRKKYTLEPLQKLRHERVTEQSRVVSAAQAAHVAAREAAIAARKVREAEQERAQAERQRERELLEAGTACAADLQQAERFWVGATVRAAALLQREVAAEKRQSEAAVKEQGARSELAAARADAEVLDRHQARFTAEQRRTAELAEEEAQLDRWTADHYGKRRA